MMIQQATLAETRRYARRNVCDRKAAGLSLSLALDSGAAPNPFATGPGFAALYPGAYVAFHNELGWNATAHTWADQSGNGRNGSLKGAGIPVLTANSFGTKSAIVFGTNTCGIQFSLSLPAPGTTPFYIEMGVAMTAWTISALLFAGTTVAAPGIKQAVGSPTVQQQVSSASNTSSGLAINSYGVITAYFSNSTNDYIQAGTTKSTLPGTTSGNTATETVFAIGNNATNAGALINLLYFVIAPGTPPATSRLAAKGYWPGLVA